MDGKLNWMKNKYPEYFFFIVYSISRLCSCLTTRKQRQLMCCVAQKLFRFYYLSIFFLSVYLVSIYPFSIYLSILCVNSGSKLGLQRKQKTFFLLKPKKKQNLYSVSNFYSVRDIFNLSVTFFLTFICRLTSFFFFFADSFSS